MKATPAEWPGRVQICDPDIARYFPYGLRLGNSILVLGKPGAGKSTLMARLIRGQHPAETLWISYDELDDAVRERAARIGGTPLATSVFTLATRSAARAVRRIAEDRPRLVVVDGLALGHTADGTIANELRDDAQHRYVLVLASTTPFGPKTFGHRFDTVMEISHKGLRIPKNRRGPADG